jgi:hypothetical protein
MSDNISELNAHTPSVESVISRLDRYRERIKEITVVVCWDDDSYDVCHDQKPTEKLCFDAAVLDKYIKSLIGDIDDE